MFTSLPVFQVVLDFQQQAVEQGAISRTGDALFGGFIGSVLSGVFAIGLLLVLFQLISGAIDWISSNGDKGKVDSARQKITNAVVGIIVLAATVAFFMIIQTFVGVKVLDFGGGGGSGSSGSGSSSGTGSTSQCSSGYSYCAGCIQGCRDTRQTTCNTYIDRECAQTACIGRGVHVSTNPGKACCAGLMQCPNGRCDIGCGTQ